MAAIDHETRTELGCGEFLTSLGHARCIVVGLVSSAQDDMAIAVAHRFYDSHLAILVHTQEMMWPLGSENRIDGNPQALTPSPAW